MTIERMRKLRPVRTWHWPPSRKWLLSLPKSGIIEYLVVVYYNWYLAEEKNQRAAEFTTELLNKVYKLEDELKKMKELKDE